MSNEELQAIVTAAVTEAVAALTVLPTQEVKPAPKQKGKSAPKKGSWPTKEERAAKSVANKAANAQVNTQLGKITKEINRAKEAGEDTNMELVASYLEAAMSAVPMRKDKHGNLTWQSTIDRIKARAVEVLV